MSRSEKKGATSRIPMPDHVLSDADIARFLRSLATLYRDKRSGNKALSDGLNRVAKKLSAKPPRQPTNSIPVEKRPGPRMKLNELRQLDADAVVHFLTDRTRTKLDLIDLAAARFSIPRARLLRLKASEVRDIIRVSLKNEESLKIITREAERNGATRRS